MLRSLISPFLVAAMLFGTAAKAAVWPQQVGKDQLKSEQPIQVTGDPGLWEEYGLVSATKGDYGSFQATAYRFKDATDAFAAEQWLASSNRNVAVAGRYVVTCVGRCPATKEFQQLPLPDKGTDQEPPVWAYMPSRGRVTGSERYALGPVGLQQFAPEVPVSAAAFQFGTEVVTSKYRTPKGQVQLILMSFPLAQMARRQAAELQKLNGVAVKRVGPLVAVAPNAPDAAAADSLLQQINYQASVNWDEKPPVKVTAQSLASMILTIFKLAGLLILFCLVAGLSFAGIKVARKRLGYENAGDAMIVIHLVDR
jgi:hypothetical protein